jgi:glycosyltransferase involved in cell wall biosynthesis
MPENIRVLHVITRLDMGGSAQEALQTVLALDPQCYQVVLIKGDTAESAMISTELQRVNQQLAVASDKGVELINLPSLVRRISPWNDLRAFVLIWSIIRRYKPHIVHTHTSKAGVLGRLAAWLARVPVIIHKPHGHVFYGHFSPSLSRFFLHIERLLGRITDHIVALTPMEARDYLTLRVLTSDKISIIHSGVDVHRFIAGAKQRTRKRKELGIPADSMVIGYVGWLIPIKGVTHLVNAMVRVAEKYPKSILVLVGKGDEKGEEEIKLKEQVENLRLNDKVYFLGWRSDVDEIMGCFDIFVLPSSNEGMGRVLVEAMAAGLPVVASRVGGIPDLIKDGQNGILVPPADAIALGNGIAALLEDKAKRKRMGQAGTKMCRQYSTEAMVERIDGLYRELLEECSHRANTPVRFLLDTNRDKLKG